MICVLEVDKYTVAGVAWFFQILLAASGFSLVAARMFARHHFDGLETGFGGSVLSLTCCRGFETTCFCYGGWPYTGLSVRFIHNPSEIQ
jgi:hypothetical protein